MTQMPKMQKVGCKKWIWNKVQAEHPRRRNPNLPSPERIEEMIGEQTEEAKRLKQALKDLSNSTDDAAEALRQEIRTKLIKAQDWDFAGTSLLLINFADKYTALDPDWVDDGCHEDSDGTYPQEVNDGTQS